MHVGGNNLISFGVYSVKIQAQAFLMGKTSSTTLSILRTDSSFFIFFSKETESRITWLDFESRFGRYGAVMPLPL